MKLLPGSLLQAPQQRAGFGVAMLLGCALLPFGAVAADAPWLLRVGVHQVDPKSDNGVVAGADLGVDKKIGVTFNVDYFFTPNLALDVLAALPFQHDIALNGSKVGSVKHLPPVVSLQYHFLPDSSVRPFVGAGVNYTLFMSEKLDGGGKLSLDDSFGLAAQAGVDFAVSEAWLIGADVRYIDIDSDVRVNGAKAGTAKIDPLAYGVTVGYRF